VCVSVGVSDGEDEDGLYEAVVCVYLNISGLITVLPDGSIHSVNEHFALLLFGQSKASLIGQVPIFKYMHTTRVCCMVYKQDICRIFVLII
jgi:hypothetical protein